MTIRPRFAARVFSCAALLALAANCAGGGSAGTTLPASPAGSRSVDTPAIAAVAATANPPYVAAVLADLPVAYYRLNTPTSLSFEDTSINGNKATIVGTPAFLQGDLLPQSATSNSVSFAKGYASETATWTNNAVTAEAWIRPTAGDLSANFSPRLIGNAWADHSGKGFMLWIEGGSAAFNAGYHTVKAPVSLTAGTAYHIVGVYDPTNTTNTIQLYVNGSLVNAASIRSGLPAVNVGDSANTYVGVLDAGTQFGFVDFFGGLMSEVAVYDHALPPSHVLTHFQVGFGNGKSAAPAPIAGSVSAMPASLSFTQTGTAAAQSITATQSGGSGSFTAAASGGDPTTITLAVSGAKITVTPVHAGATSVVITGSNGESTIVPVGITITSIGIH